MDHHLSNFPFRRREFLRLLGLGAIGLSVPHFTRGWPLNPRCSKMPFYVGTYTSAKSEGIYLYTLDLNSGELDHIGTTRGVKDPSFLSVAPNRRYLYAVNELEEFDGKKQGGVSSFAVNQRSGELSFLNQQPSLGGAPCYLTVDQKSQFVLVANYTGGNVAVFPILRDGRLGAAIDMKQDFGSSINSQRQEGPHAHCIVLAPKERFAYVCDLGTDKIMIYRFDRTNGKLTPAEKPWVKLDPGSGPRHLTFHSTGKYAFVINEMKATVTAFSCNANNGELKVVQTVPTLPPNFTDENTSADIHISPDGRFLYSSNRGQDSVVAFEIDPREGKLTFIGNQPTGGKKPRNFTIDPTGTFVLVANQDSDNIVVFRRDMKTGRLASTGHVATVPSPVCLKFTSPFGVECLSKD